MDAILESMIEFKNVSKEFDGREVLSNISFSLEPKGFACLTGPSGAGKSTILNLLVRVFSPTEGAILIDGANLATFPDGVLQLYRQKTGVLYQDYKLLPHLTAEENIALPLEVIGTDPGEIDGLVDGVMRRFGVVERAESFPHELSGGEKTRVALARAVVHRPSILLVDEPTGNIDPKQSQEILRFIRDIHRDGTTVIVATHDKIVVDSLNVRVIRLEDGKIVRDSVGGYDAVAAPQAVEREVVKEVTVKKQAGSAGSSRVKPIAI